MKIKCVTALTWWLILIQSALDIIGCFAHQDWQPTQLIGPLQWVDPTFLWAICKFFKVFSFRFVSFLSDWWWWRTTRVDSVVCLITTLYNNDKVAQEVTQELNRIACQKRTPFEFVFEEVTTLLFTASEGTDSSDNGNSQQDSWCLQIYLFENKNNFVKGLSDRFSSWFSTWMRSVLTYISQLVSTRVWWLCMSCYTFLLKRRFPHTLMFLVSGFYSVNSAASTGDEPTCQTSETVVVRWGHTQDVQFDQRWAILSTVVFSLNDKRKINLIKYHEYSARWHLAGITLISLGTFHIFLLKVLKSRWIN